MSPPPINPSARRLRALVPLCRYAICALAAASAWAALAQPLLAPAPAAAEKAVIRPNLGPLMLSPIQRKNLEYLRNSSEGSRGSGMALDELLDPRAGLPETLAISGVVIRSGGRSTVWLNNQPLYGQDGASAMRTLAGQAGVLQPGSRDMQLRAKPGTVVDVPTRQATDLLPPGAIRIIAPKAGAVSSSSSKEGAS